MQRVQVAPADRFWPKVQQGEPDACWPWLAYVTREGYGQFRFEGRIEYAHRVSYALAHGPIPSELHIDHLCRNRACVNPFHLEAVTVAENTSRAQGWTETHCKRGHHVSEARINKKGQRDCRPCRRDAMREKRKRNAKSSNSL